MEMAITDYIAGKELEHLDLAQANIVLSKHMGQDIMAEFKAIVGGEIQTFTELMQEVRATAANRMIEEEQALGTDAIVTMR